MVKDWIEDLLTLTDDDWNRYAFNRDPLSGRITPDQQIKYASEAMAVGKKLANRLQVEYGYVFPEEVIQKQGLNLFFRSGQSITGQLMFAYFEEPNSITVFLDNANAADALLQEQDLQSALGNVKTSNLLIAHELYHYLEQNEPDVFTAQKHITLWKLGPFENRSRIMCLEEIGAMAFARELTGLQCSAYIFNVLLLYPQNPQRARELYEGIMRFKTVGRE